ncbi:MAG: universal stress protein [Coriobacteriales bacterium]
MYRNILIAADGSDNSLRATQQAADIASLLDEAKVTIVSVIAIDVYSDMVYDPIEAHGEAQREIIRDAEQVLADAGIDYEVVLLHGRPADEIIRYAAETEADLLVIGSRGLGALREFALGSVSHKVLTHAKCPVLVVK